MKIVVIGCRGQLGQEMMKLLQGQDCEAIGINYLYVNF